MGAININGGLHTLVLDTVQIITRYNKSEENDIGDVKLIFKNTYDDEENGQPKKYSINAKSAMAPDIFYFVHIDVDLDQIQDFLNNPDYLDRQDYLDSEFSKKRRGNREGEVFESLIQVQTGRYQGQYQR